MTPRLYAVALALAGLPLFHAAADTLTVCESGCAHDSIQDAINAAIPGDVIEVSAGEYFEINVNPSGKAITIRGEVGSKTGEPLVVINGGGVDGSCLLCITGETSATVFENLRLVGGGGTEDPPLAGTNAGGIFIRSSGPTFRNIWADGNLHGQVYCNSGDATFENCRFINNPDQGWLNKTAVYQTVGWQLDACHMEFLNCEFADNHGEFAGAMYARHWEGSTLRMEGCTFTGNVGNSAGGIYINGPEEGNTGYASTLLVGCTFINNTGTASYDGTGAISSGANIRIEGCEITGNQGAKYGAIGLSLPMVDFGMTVPGSYLYTKSSNVCGNSLPQVPPYACPEPLVVSEDSSNCLYTLCGDCSNIGGHELGSCCTEGGCLPLTSEDCASLGATWVEADTSCENCPSTSTSTCPADTNGDSVVDGQDLAAVLAAWGLPCDG